MPFLREYELSVGSDAGSTLIAASEARTLRVVFDITHEWGGNRSLANIVVYGFSRATEGRIFKEYDQINLTAGYKGETGLIFSGEISNIVKERSGPERMTRIFALSDRLSTDKSSISETAGPGTTVVDLIKRCGEALGIPVVIKARDFSGEPKYSRGRVMAGDPVMILRELADTHKFEFTIESGRIRVMKIGAASSNSPLVIGQGTGMIGSPEVTEYGVNVSVNLASNIRLGHKIEIDSRTPVVSISSVLYQNIETTVDVGVYTVQAVTHRGDSHGDAWETNLEGWRFGQ